MTRLYCAGKSDEHWFMLVLNLLIIGFPAVAKQALVSAPLSAGEVVERAVEMNNTRAKALEGYSSLRTYYLGCHYLSHKKADMIVRINYQAPDKKKSSRSCRTVPLTLSGTASSKNSWRENKSRCGARNSSNLPSRLRTIQFVEHT